MQIIRVLLALLFTWCIARSIIYLFPGDPAIMLAQESFITITPDEMRQVLQTDLLPYERITTLPINHSLIHKVKASDLLLPALKNSFILTLLIVFFGGLLTFITLYISFISKRLAPAIQSVTTFFAATPLIILGPCIIYFIALVFPRYPIIGHPFLPALALSIYLSSFWIRSIQVQIKNFIPQSAIAGARARGISEKMVFYRYLFLPLFGRIAGYFGTQLGSILSGSVIAEVLFQWPGLGTLIYKSTLQRDYPVIEYTLLIAALISVLSQQIGYRIQMKLEPKL